MLHSTGKKHDNELPNKITFPNDSKRKESLHFSRILTMERYSVKSSMVFGPQRRGQGVTLAESLPKAMRMVDNFAVSLVPWRVENALRMLFV